MVNIENNKKIEFLSELEKLKLVYRQNSTIGNTRFENSAEHSWHLAIMVLLFDTEIDEKVDVLKVIKMVLIHDIVEIDAGDTFIYNKNIEDESVEEEYLAAERIFGKLPKKQEMDFKQLWLEFEARETTEAKYAAALDAIQPLLNHSITGVGNPHGLKKSQVIARKKHIRNISKSLWELAKELIDKNVELGLFKDE